MHNVLGLLYPVRVLKCLPLHPIQNRSRYAYRDIRFCTDSTVPPSEAVQADTRQVQRQDQGVVDVSLEPFADSDVRPAHGLRKFTDITTAHAKKSKHLGFGHQPINRQMLSKANTFRDHRIFEEFAFHMVYIAQSRRITKEFELHGRFYAIDSTTIDLCMSVFR